MLASKAIGTSTVNSWNLEGISPCDPDGMAFYDGTLYSCFSVQDIPFDTWVHFAIGYDGASKYAYVNGELRLNVATTTITFTANDIFIGADQSDTLATSHYLGPLDDIRIYDRLLSAAEIAALAN